MAAGNSPGVAGDDDGEGQRERLLEIEDELPRLFRVVGVGRGSGAIALAELGVWEQRWELRQNDNNHNLKSTKLFQITTKITYLNNSVQALTWVDDDIGRGKGGNDVRLGLVQLPANRRTLGIEAVARMRWRRRSGSGRRRGSGRGRRRTLSLAVTLDDEFVVFVDVQLENVLIELGAFCHF